MLDLSLGNVVAWAIQVAAIGTVGALLPLLLRITSPRARLFYLRAVLVACLALPLVQPWLPARAVAPAAMDGASLAADQALLSGAAPPAGSAARAASDARTGRAASWPWSVDRTVIVVYLAGVALRLAWIGLGFAFLARIRRTSLPLDPRPSAIDDAALLVGTDADFRASDRVVRPVTFGLRRPVVLVPPGFETFDATQQTAIAAHELLHVARRDWLHAIGDQLILSVLWFHPAVWWLMEQIHLSVEQVIDRAVVNLVGARKPYLEALLKLAAAGPTPLLQPAAAFLKHGHLAQRVALLVKEGAMSRLRLVTSFALVLLLLGAGGFYVVQAFPLTAAVLAVAAPVVVGPSSVATSVPVPMVPPPAVAKESAPQSTSGQQTHPTVNPKTQQVTPGMPTAGQPPLPPLPPPPPPPPPVTGVWGGQSTPPPTRPFDLAAWEKGVEIINAHVLETPGDPLARYSLAAAYWDRVFRDTSLGETDKRTFISLGLQEIDTALGQKPDYSDAMVFKGLLLRLQAGLESDPGKKQALIAQADKLRDQATQLRNAQNPWNAIPTDAVRVGGSIAPPMKLKDVKPVYPAVAQDARVQGVVIIEAVIGPDGKVQSAHVLRSVPGLDQAALDAVRQWEFRPTLLNGSPVPVVMTSTVNFTLDGSSGGTGTGVGLGTGIGTGVTGGVAGGVTGGVPGGVAGGVAGGIAGGVVPADNSWARSIAPDAVRVGGTIRPPTKIKDVKPVYPADAKDAGVQGVVILEAVIAPNGEVTAARVVRSIPALDQAALDAVKQWVFTPTLQSGNPVSIVMTVTVNFTLQ